MKKDVHFCSLHEIGGWIFCLCNCVSIGNQEHFLGKVFLHQKLSHNSNFSFRRHLLINDYAKAQIVSYTITKIIRLEDNGK